MPKFDWKAQVLAFAAFYLALPMILAAGTPPLERLLPTTVAGWPVLHFACSLGAAWLCGGLARWSPLFNSAIAVTLGAALQLTQPQLAAQPAWMLSLSTALEFAAGAVGYVMFNLTRRAMVALARRWPVPGNRRVEPWPVPWSGGRPPSRAIRVLNGAAGLLLVFLAVTALIGLLFSDFVPSPATVRSARAIAIATGILYGVVFLGVGDFGWSLRNPKVAAVARTQRSVARASLRVPLMALVAFGFAWTSMSSVVPWALNALAGSDGAMAVEVDGWDNETWGARSGRTCAHPTLRGIPFGMLGRRALCVDPATRSQFAVGASIVLMGRASVFGISPVRYRVREAAAR